MATDTTFTSFAGDALVASGDLGTVLQASKDRQVADFEAQILIFDDSTGRQVDFDLQAPVAETLEQQTGAAARGPGRPRLGVVAREVTLLPRHWDWLADQPSGASAALRRLVDAARRNESLSDRARRAAAAAGRVMTVLAGNRPNFEEAYRALDAGEQDRFQELIRDWPEDVRGHVLKQAEPAFATRE